MLDFVGLVDKNSAVVCLTACLSCPRTMRIKNFTQGFMQDKIIASHTCFGGHMDVSC